MDYVTGTIMSNGLLFTGNETIDGKLISPLTDVGLTGIVNSNTIFDNFRIYFRDTNHIIELNNFPVDLTLFSDNKPHFLYIKEDLTYRVSDYVFGQADEVGICRFIIKDNNWLQCYITAQRAGTPMYNAGEEFYDLDGIYCTSPGGLNLSITDGLVKRSGIEFDDPFSPDLYHSFKTSADIQPLRYTDLNNEIDYTLDTVTEVDPNHYMNYDYNAKAKTKYSEQIRILKDMCTELYTYLEEKEEELKHIIIVAADDEISEESNKVIQLIKAHTNEILDLGISISTSMKADSFSSSIKNVDFCTETIRTNINKLYTTLLTACKNRDSDSIISTINALRGYFFEGYNSSITYPIVPTFDTIYETLQDLTITSGTLSSVPSGKLTIQRVLWDIYEQCLILQYGDKTYDTLEDAVADVNSVTYPVPFGHLLYIPLAALILQQGCTEINTDQQSCIVIKQYIYADSEQEGFADYIARALANKALKWCEKLEDTKLNRDGTQPMTGTLNAQTILPTITNTWDLGSSSKRWNNLYVKNIDASGNVNIGGNLSATNISVSGSLSNTDGSTYVVTGPNPQTALRLEADTVANITSRWSSYQKGTVAVCW